MRKAILLSVRPYWAYLIWKLLKTLEIRKRVPKWLNLFTFIYVTIRPQDLKKIPEEHREMVKSWMGKVPMRFWFDEYEEIKQDLEPDYFGEVDGQIYIGDNPFWPKYNIEKLSCVDEIEIMEYYENVKVKKDSVIGYAWHIKNLEIFDEPKLLSEFYNYKKYNDSIEKVSRSARETCGLYKLSDEIKESLECYKTTFDNMIKSTHGIKLTKAPQSYQYVWVKE